MKLHSILALVAISPIALAQATNYAPAGGDAKEIRHKPADSELCILSVTPTQAAEPGVMIMRGTGLNRVEQVLLDDVPTKILSQSRNELRFLPREGNPGACMAVALTRFERDEFKTMLMPCIAAKKQDLFQAVYFEPHQGIADAVEIELVSGAQGFYAIWMSPNERLSPLVIDPPIAYEFWLGEPYYFLDFGFLPSYVDRVQLQYRIPPDMWGQTLFFQGQVLQQFPTHDRRSFTNMEAVDF